MVVSPVHFLQEAFVECARAYEVLGDQSQRRQYDAQLRAKASEGITIQLLEQTASLMRILSEFERM